MLRIQERVAYETHIFSQCLQVDKSATLFILYSRIICNIFVEVLVHCIPLGQQQIVLQNFVSLYGTSVGKFTTWMSLSVHIWLEFLEIMSST